MIHSVTRTLAAAATALVVALPLAAYSQGEGLTIKSATGDHVFTVDVVDTPETRAKGLMNVHELAPDAGMLFDFKEERPVAFWMMNTFIPLDMLFITADGTIKNIHVNAVPHDKTSIPSDGPVQYVLEVPGGRTVELGIEAGDSVVHSRIQ
ncbi:DUF192 domain-containing protein [Devosia sp. MC521]|uniref:DUF192 domain-containing protein n=1 Tax=Devosia sp. MC521 TaxID=2759954 RepID=UPI0015FE76BA|nr:DUF192 domain-containing protein [Devosia sp. MC521]MBJ6986875.1 DUF192 domain-containing protein [Devosia sp. MC521]QMW63905.1 DUF192 domain-containing protein [Devosia sp. MC521]